MLTHLKKNVTTAGMEKNDFGIVENSWRENLEVQDSVPQKGLSCIRIYIQASVGPILYPDIYPGLSTSVGPILDPDLASYPCLLY